MITFIFLFVKFRRLSWKKKFYIYIPPNHLILIYSHREENNRRYYDDSDIVWTQFIIRLKKTGMSIKNMQEYAELRYKGDSTIPQRLRLLFFQLDELHKQQTEINQHIDFLEKKIKTYLGINPN